MRSKSESGLHKHAGARYKKGTPLRLSLIARTGNGERGTGNGERGTGNGERGTGNGERGTGTGNGES